MENRSYISNPDEMTREAADGMKVRMRYNKRRRSVCGYTK